MKRDAVQFRIDSDEIISSARNNTEITISTVNKKMFQTGYPRHYDTSNKGIRDSFLTWNYFLCRRIETTPDYTYVNTVFEETYRKDFIEKNAGNPLKKDLDIFQQMLGIRFLHSLRDSLNNIPAGYLPIPGKIYFSEILPDNTDRTIPNYSIQFQIAWKLDCDDSIKLAKGLDRTHPLGELLLIGIYNTVTQTTSFTKLGRWIAKLGENMTTKAILIQPTTKSLFNIQEHTPDLLHRYYVEDMFPPDGREYYSADMHKRFWKPIFRNLWDIQYYICNAYAIPQRDIYPNIIGLSDAEKQFPNIQEVVQVQE